MKHLLIAKAALERSDSLTQSGRFRQRLAELSKAAETLAAETPLDVTRKPSAPPGGDLRDYSSVGPYWWRDPDKPDGRPYIRRDGELNPEARVGNAPDLETMCERVHLLTMAWHWTRESRFAQAAARQLRAWFLDEATAMRPHLEFAQAIPGICEGRGIGIIESEALVLIPDDATLLLASGAWSEVEHDALRQWFRAYLGWMLCSEKGRKEALERNNHGSWFDAQVVVFAAFADRPEIAMTVLRHSLPAHMERQLADDGSQPHELARTLSWNYSIFNLQAFLTAALAGRSFGIDLAAWRGSGGQSLADALLFLFERAPGTGAEWTWPQIEPREHMDSRFPGWSGLLGRAAILFDGVPEIRDRLAELAGEVASPAGMEAPLPGEFD